MEEKEVKMTKKDYYGEMIELVENSDVERKDEIIDFLNKQIANLEKRAEAARTRAAAKKAEGDELREVIKSVLTDEYQTAEEITAQIEDDDVSVAKVRARLTQLVKAGDAVKEKSEEKKVMTYKLA